MPAINKILLIEDNLADARLVREALTDAVPPLDSGLVHVTRLSEAIPLLEQERFSAILLDLSLPDTTDSLDGLSVMRVHAMETPVIVLTGLDDELVALQALEAGAQDYVVKGRFDAGLLTRSIGYAIERQRTVDLLQQRQAEAEARNKELGVTLGELVAEVARREQAESSLRAETALVELIGAVSTAANQSTSTDAVILDTIHLVCAYLHWPVGHCYRREGAGWISSALWHIDRPEDFERFRQITEATTGTAIGLVNEVLATGRAVWWPDVDAEPSFVRRAQGLRVRSATAFPVFVGTEIVAVLEFFTDQPRETKTNAHLLAELPQIGMQIGRVMERERSERAVRDSEDRYRDLIEASADMICTHDLNGMILAANRAMTETLAGEGGPSLAGRNIREFLSREVRSEFDNYLATIRDHDRAHGLMKIVNADGVKRIFEYRNTRRSEGVNEPIVRAVARDITDRFFAERALAESEQRYRILFERNLAGICRLTRDGEIVDCNDSLAHLLGYENAPGLMGVKFVLQPVNVYWDTIAARLEEETFLPDVELCLVRRDGQLLWALTNLSYMRAEGTKPPSIEAICIDITQRKFSEDENAFEAYHDALTRLANRTMFNDHLALALANRRAAEEGLSVLYIDLDGFKPINDNFGHEVGDQVLKDVAERFLRCVRPSDTVARLGGDEFAIILVDVGSQETLSNIANELLDSLHEPFLCESAELRVTASLGIAVAPRDGTTPELLIRKADVAMYQAKIAGKNTFRFAAGGAARSPAKETPKSPTR